MLEARDITGLSSFDLRYGPAYTSLIVQTMKQSYEFAKKGAADELGVDSPATSRETAQLFNQNANAVVQKQLSDLLFSIKTDVLSEVRRQGIAQTDVPGVIAQVGETFDQFKAAQMAMGGSVAVAIAVNRGRGDVFAANRDQIAVYQYSAILDNKVCPTCRDLDGTTMDYATYANFAWKPPIHIFCRCILVAVYKDQTEIPATTAVPEQPGGWTEPLL